MSLGGSTIIGQYLLLSVSIERTYPFQCRSPDSIKVQSVQESLMDGFIKCFGKIKECNVYFVFF